MTVDIARATPALQRSPQAAYLEKDLMTNTAKTRYVLMTVFHPELSFVVGITKKRGPAFLLGKLTFPRGKLEQGETAAEAASREMLEETGLPIPRDVWRLVEHVEHADCELTVLTATSAAFYNARTLEDEPVWHLAVERHLAYAKAQPAQYSADFIRLLEDSLRVVRSRTEAPVEA